MELALLGHNWNRLAETDPMWAILMDPTRRGNLWNPADFFATGQSDVNYMMSRCREQRIRLRPGRALDFGCGLGRLTQALACHFDEVTGVDIAPAMIRQARQCNPYGDRVRFMVNERNDLGQLPSNQFEFVTSLIVLQHMRPDYCLNYVAEFLRILAPGGILLFQEPGHHHNWKQPADYVPMSYRIRRKLRMAGQALYGAAARKMGVENPWAAIPAPRNKRLPPNIDVALGGPELEIPRGSSANGQVNRVDAAHTSTGPEPPKTEIYTIRRRKMIRFLRKHGGRVLHVEPRNECGEHFASYRYFVTK